MWHHFHVGSLFFFFFDTGLDVDIQSFCALAQNIKQKCTCSNHCGFIFYNKLFPYFSPLFLFLKQFEILGSKMKIERFTDSFNITILKREYFVSCIKRLFFKLIQNCLLKYRTCFEGGAGFWFCFLIP